MEFLTEFMETGATSLYGEVGRVVRAAPPYQGHHPGARPLSSQPGTRRLFWLVILGVVAYAVLDAVVQALPPHYSPIREAESDLAVGPYGYVMTANFLLRGTLSLVFLYALLKLMSQLPSDGSQAHVRRPTGGVLAMGVWSVGALLLAIFPTDVPPTPVSWHGAIHLIVAILAFVGGTLGALLLSIRFGESPSLRRARAHLLPLAGLSLAFLVLLLGSSGTSVGGLTERLFLGSVLLWLCVASFFLSKVGDAPSSTPA